jgi:hypothetical protein
MIDLKNLFKVLVKPRKAFEELQGTAKIREGLMAWGFCSVISLMFAYFAASKMDFTFFFIDFGFGSSIELLSIIKGLGVTIALLFVISYLAWFAASKFGGTGTFADTFGMLGYAKVLVIMRGLAAAVFSIIAWMRTYSAMEIGAKGGIMPANLFTAYLTPILIITGVFLLWSLVLDSYALSISNNISLKKAVPIMLVLAFASIAVIGVLL